MIWRHAFLRARGSFDRTAVHRRNAMWSPFLPPDSPSSLPGWLHMLWTLPDERVLVLCGADAYMFLRFLRMGLTVRSLCHHSQFFSLVDLASRHLINGCPSIRSLSRCW